MRLGLVAVCATMAVIVAFGQVAEEKTFKFSNAALAEAQKEIGNAIVTATDRTLTVEVTDGTLRLRGAGPALEIGEWVFRGLDRSPADQGSAGNSDEELPIPGSDPEKVAIFHLRPRTEPALTQTVNIVLAIANIRSSATVHSVPAFVVRAGIDNLRVAAWLFDRLDHPRSQDETVTALGLGLRGPAAQDQIVRVLYPTVNPPTAPIEEVSQAIRIVVAFHVAIAAHSPEALVVRDQASMVELATWLFHDMEGAGETPGPGTHERQLPGPDEILRVFYLPADATALNDLATAIRANTLIMRLVVCPVRHALVMRGTRAQIAKATQTIEEFAKPPVPDAFDVVSVKPRKDDTSNPIIQFRADRIMMRNVVLTNLVLSAYSLQSDRFSGPNWMDTERYDVNAKATASVPESQLRRMLQLLLAERFHLATHQERRVLEGYVLVVSKSGLKIHPLAPDPGNPSLPRAFTPSRIIGKSASVQDLARTLEALLNCPVEDRTQIEGVFDYDLRFSPDPVVRATRGSQPALEVLPRLPDALERQLGFRLAKQKLTVDVLVVDHVDRVPVEN